MKERPILFAGPMVNAILDERKFVTRRVVKPRSKDADGLCAYTQDGVGVVEILDRFEGEPLDGVPLCCPYGVPGDRLWVRETWYDDYAIVDAPRERFDDGRVEGIEYRATHDCRAWEAGCPCNPDGSGKRSEWRPSIHMPRWASRLLLEIVSVRVEQIQGITEDDARAEGVLPFVLRRVHTGIRARIWTPAKVQCTHIEAFRNLWDELNDARGQGWSSNPWVWRIEFRRLTD